MLTSAVGVVLLTVLVATVALAARRAAGAKVDGSAARTSTTVPPRTTERAAVDFEGYLSRLGIATAISTSTRSDSFRTG